MSSEEQKIKGTPKQKKGGMDMMHLSKVLWKHRKLFYKVLPITFVVACLYGLSLPKSYHCQVMLAPELSTARTSNSLSSLARQFGMKLGSNIMGNSSEALLPNLYPDMMNSVDFATSLFDIPVCAEDSVVPKRYYDYLSNDRKRPWWSEAIGSTIGAIVDLFVTKDSTDQIKEVNPFKLTKKQAKICDIIARNVVCDVDEKTLVITIEVTDQDPVICATIADSVKARLQDFITAYRTNKARVDYEYNKKLCAEAKIRYDKARQLYAEFADANQDVVLQSVRTKIMNLENEMQLQFSAYQTYVAQLQNAEAQIQQDTPAFMTLQSATVPLNSFKPRKKKIAIVALFLAFLCTSAYVLHKEGELKPLLGLS